MLKKQEVILTSELHARELFKMALKSVDQVYLIIDRLDECDQKQQRKIIKWFCNLVRSLPKMKSENIRCLFVPQHDAILRRLLLDVPTLQICETDN
jgi:hypothetical protein